MMTVRRPRSLIYAVPLRFALAAAFSVCFGSPADASNTSAAAGRRQSAHTQFDRAEDLRAALNSKLPANRNLEEYKNVVSAYRRVYLLTPNALEVPEALFDVAQLYEEMGGKFGSKYYQSAADTYQFLIHEYPANRHVPESLLRLGWLQSEELNQADLAAKTYQEYLRLYPHSPHRREVQEHLADLALSRSTSPQVAETPAKSPLAKAVAQGAAAARTSGSASEGPTIAARSRVVSHVSRITTMAASGSTRIVISLDHKVAYQSAQIAHPDRIYFDLDQAQVSPQLAGHTINVKDILLKEIRVAQNPGGVVRIVFDVDDVNDYTASLLDHPARLVVDLHAGRVPEGNDSAPREARAPTAAPHADAASVSSSSAAPAPRPTDASRDSSAMAAPASGATPTKARTTRAVLSTRLGPPPVPQPTRDGQQSLTRTLGLKIGRIVIDPGHGGHDTGTIGPTGFMEKDLCLDVALRLGKIIEQRLPGAEVIFTRQDDTFVPLEERTKIANEAKADLFLSIHANSSDDHTARGVETYYLNMKGTPEAMQVAARENASSDESVHQLEELVAKIAQGEKREESREFASEIQDSLLRRVQRTSRDIKNRGVRRAPFVVLIGANMPSALTEISFLSNPSDEQLLKKPETRQRIAEGLYRGVAHYLQILNSLTYNLPRRDAADRAEGVAHSGNQR
jgi:N-acetylmuramoyl-L-alanine amidase